MLLTAVAVVPESQLWTLEEPQRSEIARGLAWAASTQAKEVRRASPSVGREDPVLSTRRCAFSMAVVFALLLASADRSVFAQSSATAESRPRVGVALGGGSARGIAHVGVLRWLDEHHVPIDVLAGTSMGGLIGGSFATGMSADEIEAMLAGVDWDAVFGSSNFRFQEHPPQAGRARVSIAPRVRPQAGNHRADLAQ